MHIHGMRQQTTILPKVLSLKENRYARYEWSNDTLLVRCEYSNVTMADGEGEYPELFNEKYMSVPQAYMVKLPMDSSFFTDLDADGTLEELNCTGFNDDVGTGYTDFGLYTDTDGYYHYEECVAYDFNPYYVKTADGNHYLYVFREESNVENRQMVLMVYNVTGGKFAKVGEMNVAPQYFADNVFIFPLDPGSMWLVGPDDTSANEYYVGDSGMPVKDI